MFFPLNSNNSCEHKRIIIQDLKNEYGRKTKTRYSCEICGHSFVAFSYKYEFSAKILEDEIIKKPKVKNKMIYKHAKDLEGKQIKIVLGSGYHFSGKIKKAHSDSFEFIDKFSQYMRVYYHSVAAVIMEGI